MNENKILIEIKNILKNIDDLNPKISIDLIQLNTHFKNELGFDSIALISLLYELQETYSFLDENQISKWETVHDCVNSIISKGD